ncbi:endonuclease V, partial [Mesotoga sp. SC_3PWM13N19]
MNIRHIHSWSMEPNQAIALQNKLANQLVLHTRIAKPRLIAGVDVSFPSRATALAVVVVLEFSTLQVVDCFHAIGKVDTPYIPGLLSFREGPTILNALSKSSEVDLLFFDGHGIAHPRGIGIA